MEFWTLFNIAVVSSVGALSLFFLISTIAVAAKGKRKCNAFDVVLRILSTLCFIAATALVLCAVLTVIEAPVCIKFNAPAIEGDPLVPVFVLSGKESVLPLAELFLLFSTEIGIVIGFAVSILLFLCSLMALTVDCLVANKKVKKAPSAAAVKSAEQIKRERELEKIKKIGESAVRKTAKVAEDESAFETAGTEKTTAPESDWRNDDTPEKSDDSDSAAFVGITENSDEAFDTFEAFDNSDNDRADAEEMPQDEESTLERDISAEDRQEEKSDVEEFEHVAYGPVEKESDAEEVNTDELEPIKNETSENYDTEYDKEDVYTISDEQPAEQDNTEEVYGGEEEQSVENEQISAEENVVPEKSDDIGYDDLEPDRGIYIPEIRTILKPNDDPEPVLKPSTTQKSTAKKSTAKSASGAAKPAAKSKTTGKSGGVGAKRAGSSSKRDSDTTPQEKKLPVTRRYVILDRRNAVNMFGEYLRERNKAEKEKLQSSINTIIIE